MSTICSAGHRRRVEEVNEAVLPPRVQPLPHTSLDVLFNTARKALWQVPWLWGRLPCCRGPYYIQRAACLQGCWRASEKDEFWGCLYSLMIKYTVCGFFFFHCTVSIMQAHLCAVWATKLNIAKQPQQALRLKVHRESKQPKVYRPTFIFKYNVDFSYTQDNRTSLFALEAWAAADTFAEEFTGQWQIASRPQCSTEHHACRRAQSEKFYSVRRTSPWVLWVPR